MIRAAKQATSTIPIVTALGIDAVGQGFIASIQRPGGNITWVAWDPGPAKRVFYVPSSPASDRDVGRLIPLPDISVWREAVAMNSLMSYGVNIPGLYRRAAVYGTQVARQEGSARPDPLCTSQR